MSTGEPRISEPSTVWFKIIWIPQERPVNPYLQHTLILIHGPAHPWPYDLLGCCEKN